MKGYALIGKDIVDTNTGITWHTSNCTDIQPLAGGEVGGGVGMSDFVKGYNNAAIAECSSTELFEQWYRLAVAWDESEEVGC